MKSFLCFIVGFGSLLFISCKSYTVDCEDLGLSTTFIGFNQAEVDTLYLRQYVANTGYSTLLRTDTFDFTRNMASGLLVRHDSIDAYMYANGGIRAGFDWEMVVPSGNRVFRISNIVSEKRQIKQRNTIFNMDKTGCFNTVYSAKVDNVVKNLSDGDYRLYLRK